MPREVYSESLWSAVACKHQLDKATGAYSLDLTDAEKGGCWRPYVQYSNDKEVNDRHQYHGCRRDAGGRRRPSISISVSGRRRSADRSIRNEFGSSARTARVARATPDAHNFSNWR
jgi:hypothetical protein